MGMFFESCRISGNCGFRKLCLLHFKIKRIYKFSIYVNIYLVLSSWPQIVVAQVEIDQSAPGDKLGLSDHQVRISILHIDCCPNSFERGIVWRVFQIHLGIDYGLLRKNRSVLCTRFVRG